MATDIRAIQTPDLDETGAFRRARNGAIVLTVLVASYVVQFLLAAMPAFSRYPDLLTAATYDENAAIALFSVGMLATLSVLAIIASLFAWTVRSRIAMWFGAFLFVLNWFFYIVVWASGEFEVSGLLLNILGPYYLWKGIRGANRYHALRSGRASMTPLATFD